MKFSTLFSGCGGADAGLRAAGLTELWGIELNNAYANIARANGFNVLTQDVQLTDWGSLERPDWLHASPPCQRSRKQRKNFVAAYISARRGDRVMKNWSSTYRQRDWLSRLQKGAAFEQATKDYSDTDLNREWVKRWAEIEAEREAAFQAIALVGVLEMVN